MRRLSELMDEYTCKPPITIKAPADELERTSWIENGVEEWINVQVKEEVESVLSEIDKVLSQPREWESLE